MLTALFLLALAVVCYGVGVAFCRVGHKSDVDADEIIRKRYQETRHE